MSDNVAQVSRSYVQTYDLFTTSQLPRQRCQQRCFVFSHYLNRKCESFFFFFFVELYQYKLLLLLKSIGNYTASHRLVHISARNSRRSNVAQFCVLLIHIFFLRFFVFFLEDYVVLTCQYLGSVFSHRTEVFCGVRCYMLLTSMLATSLSA